MDWDEVQRAERWFRHNGTFFVFLGRMLPTVRSLVSVPAGLLKMRFKTFFVASTIGTAGWTSALAYAGFKLREQFTEVDEWLGPVSNAILITLVLGYAWRLIRYRIKD
jgi:membrane protein DedA with SNARE-associated domain